MHLHHALQASELQSMSLKNLLVPDKELQVPTIALPLAWQGHGGHGPKDPVWYICWPRNSKKMAT